MAKYSDIKHNHSVSLLLAHLVVTTKYRRPTLKEEYNLDFFQKILEKYKENIQIKQMEIGEDFSHLHFLIQYSNTVSVAYIAQILKGCSSKAIKDINPKFEGYSRGYHVSSTGGASIQAIENYIKNQRNKD